MYRLRKEYVLFVVVCLVCLQTAQAISSNVRKAIHNAKMSSTDEWQNFSLMLYNSEHIGALSPLEAINLARATTEAESHNQILREYTSANIHKLTVEQAIKLARATYYQAPRNQILIQYTAANAQRLTPTQIVKLSYNTSNTDYKVQLIRTYFIGNLHLKAEDFDLLIGKVSDSSLQTELRKMKLERLDKITETPSYSDQRFVIKMATGWAFNRKTHYAPVIVTSINTNNSKGPTAQVIIKDEFEAAATFRNQIDIYEVPVASLVFMATKEQYSQIPNTPTTKSHLKLRRKATLLISTEQRSEMNSGILTVDPDYHAMGKLFFERKLQSFPISDSKLSDKECTVSFHSVNP